MQLHHFSKDGNTDFVSCWMMVPEVGIEPKRGVDLMGGNPTKVSIH